MRLRMTKTIDPSSKYAYKPSKRRWRAFWRLLEGASSTGESPLPVSHIHSYKLMYRARKT